MSRAGRPNPVKRKLAAGGTALGTMVTEFATTIMPRLVAATGAEFVLYDLEHTGYGLERMRDVVAAARAVDTVTLLRVPDADYHLVARGLDLGVQGVMVPAVESAEEARAIAAASRYPPVGKRGFGLLVRGDWDDDGLPTTLRKVNEETLVLAQIETAAGLEEVESIAAVDGIDVLWVGHFDLTASLGIPGDFADPRFAAALARVVAAADGAGKAAGLVVGDAADAREKHALGFRALALGMDTWLYQDALSSGLGEIRDLAE